MDKLLPPTYDCPIMASERIQRRIDSLLDEADAYADTLRERGGPGDKEKAAALLEQSLAISSELGMRPLMERVLSRREFLGA